MWPGDLVDYERLARRLDGPTYRTAAPFPHAVIDDFLPPEVLRVVVDEVPPVSSPRWACWDAAAADGRVLQHGKLHISDDDALGPITRRLVSEMRGGRFLRLLTALSGIEGLLADPYNEGGGLHNSGPGAVLRIHADPVRHMTLWLLRRLNLLLYLSPNWNTAYGGCLELWPPDMSVCSKRIAPVGTLCDLFYQPDLVSRASRSAPVPTRPPSPVDRDVLLHEPDR